MARVEIQPKTENEYVIGQVGACAFPSFTGVGRQGYESSNSKHRILPRILFVEPLEFELGGGLIEVCHYEKHHNQPTREGYLNAGHSVIELDIYYPERITSPLPKKILGFLGLENVVNDQFYNRKRYIYGMLILLNQIIAPGGLVLFTDSSPHLQELFKIYYNQIVAHAPSFGFTVIFDELSSLATKQTSMKHKQTFLTGLLKELGILDPAFEEGIERNCHYEYADWLILQKLLQ